MKFAHHISACFRRGTLVALGCVSLAAFAAETPEAAVRASNLADGTGTSLSHRSRNAKSLQSSPKTVVEIADAYRLRQVDVMLEKAKNMPESFFDYVGKTCDKSPYPPLEALYVAEWGVKDTQLPHLDTLPDFEAKIASEVAFARIYGEFLCKSIPYSEVLPELEARMLKRLMGYRSQRMKEGDNEFVKVAEKYLGQWIGHIESAGGFTRTFMHSQRDLLLAGRWRHPEITEGSVGASVVSLGLFWLKTECGYLPKWAKVEFSCSGEESPHDEFHGGDLKAPIDLRRKNELVAFAFQYKLAQQKTWEQVRQTAISNCVGVLLSEGYVPAWLEQFSREPEP